MRMSKPSGRTIGEDKVGKLNILYGQKTIRYWVDSLIKTKDFRHLFKITQKTFILLLDV